MIDWIPAIIDEQLVCGVTTRMLSDDKVALAIAIAREPQLIVGLKQVHGNVIHTIDDEWHADAEVLIGDGLITRRRDVVLSVRIADCAGVLLWDSKTGTIASVHSGWRGTKEDIVGSCIERMINEFNVNPSSIRAYISPCASGERYEVREDVAQFFPEDIVRSPNSNDVWLFDNRSAIRTQLIKAGVEQTHICVDPACTMADDRFHSYRRDGAAALRCVAFIGLRSFENLVPQ
ncbi:MAG: peptidoglycan editing factor PgeF [bacterium]|nr:peptidoglycan editing factor PgeF [bacterium]